MIVWDNLVLCKLLLHLANNAKHGMPTGSVIAATCNSPMLTGIEEQVQDKLPQA